MSARPPHASPTEITLHRASRILAVRFDNGSSFDLPCEYLRVFSPSAETRAAEYAGETIVGKENVNIAQIDPVGSYAVRIAFDDGHDTGIYSWETLYELGCNHRENWNAYLARKQSHIEKQLAAPKQPPTQGPTRVMVLYFERLADRLGRESEAIEIEGPITDVRALLNTLVARDSDLQDMLSADRVTVTVNKRFASPETRLRADDEVALVPMRSLV